MINLIKDLFIEPLLWLKLLLRYLDSEKYESSGRLPRISSLVYRSEKCKNFDSISRLFDIVILHYRLTHKSHQMLHDSSMKCEFSPIYIPSCAWCIPFFFGALLSTHFPYFSSKNHRLAKPIKDGLLIHSKSNKHFQQTCRHQVLCPAVYRPDLDRAEKRGVFPSEDFRRPIRMLITQRHHKGYNFPSTKDSNQPRTRQTQI